MSKKKILLYQGGRYFGIEKNHEAFQNILAEYIVDNYENVDIFSNTDFFGYSAMIFFSQEGKFTQAQEKNVLDFIVGGKGFIGLHGASASFKSHPKYFEMLGGKFITEKDVSLINIKLVDKNHPITKNLNDFSFRDELYRHDFSMSKDLHILAEADYNDKDDLKLEPIMWIKTYGKGRVFYCALGHRNHSLKNNLFQIIIRRAVDWVIKD